MNSRKGIAFDDLCSLAETFLRKECMTTTLIACALLIALNTFEQVVGNIVLTTYRTSKTIFSLKTQV
jgi:hypothetical protein